MVIACNTAHLLVPELEMRLGYSFTSLITSTVQEISRRDIRKIAILASPTTIRTKLYEKVLQMNGIEVMLPSQAEQNIVELTIRDVIAGGGPRRLQQRFTLVTSRLRNQGAEAILLGCTELSILYPQERQTLIDPLHIVTDKLLQGETI